MGSRERRGAASAAPLASVEGNRELAQADQWEPEALRLIDTVQDPDEAEQLLARVATVAEAMRLNKVSGDREKRWRGIRLRAERRYGELLGPPTDKGGRKPTVSAAHGSSDVDRSARVQARKVAAVEADTFEDYLANEEKPTRDGLLRKDGAEKAARKPRIRGGQQTVRQHRGSPAESVEVINWVRKKTRAGVPFDRLLQLSQTAEDWPLPGKPLTTGQATACRWVIYHLELQGAQWPLKPEGSLANGRGPTATGKRLHQVGQKRAAARKSGDSIVLWDTAYDITKLCGLLQSLNIEDADLDEYGVDVLNDLHDDMLYLQEWMDVTTAAVQARLGEQELRKKITALKAKTVANGCTPEEEASARRAADRLERRLAAALSVGR